jgi:hypothetical protein
VYSVEVTRRQVQEFCAKNNVKLQYFPLDYCLEQTEKIQRAVAEVRKDGGAEMKRALTPQERLFIQNEILLCKLDFRYWAQRYAKIQAEGSGVRCVEFWESQEKLLEIIAKVEEEQYEALESGGTVDGIRICLNKSRQLGATAVSRMLTMHRLTLWPDHRAMGASVDDDKKMELYTRDRLILDNLPFFLKPQIEFEEKSQHIRFGKLNSSILYQQSQQKSGLGQGRQFELGHLTECASFPNPLMIPHDFFPTLPQSVNTLCILESTPQGRDNFWYEFTNEVRDGNWPGWHYVFVPWYTTAAKYRRTPPEGWNPSQLTLMHAKKVKETSKELVGEVIELSPDKLYWYESTRRAYTKEGNLAIFLTNYCATHEESFQHVRASAIPTETLEQLRLETIKGQPYELQI